MQTTVSGAIALHNALSALDGYERPGKDGGLVRDQYKLSGQARMAIGRNLARLASVVQAYETTRKGLIQQHTGGTGSFDGSPDALAAFAKDMGAALDEEEDLDLVPLTENDLGLSQNPIPGTVIAMLMPLLAE